MAVGIEELRADCGEVYDSLINGTTAAQSLLDKAKDKILEITSSTTARYDLAIRNLADAFVCNQVLGSSSGTSIKIASISVGSRKIKEMRDGFYQECSDSLSRYGYSLKSAGVIFKVVNQ